MTRYQPDEDPSIDPAETDADELEAHLERVAGILARAVFGGGRQTIMFENTALLREFFDETMEQAIDSGLFELAHAEILDAVEGLEDGSDDPGDEDHEEEDEHLKWADLSQRWESIEALLDRVADNMDVPEWLLDRLDVPGHGRDHFQYLPPDVVLRRIEAQKGLLALAALAWGAESEDFTRHEATVLLDIYEAGVLASVTENAGLGDKAAITICRERSIPVPDLVEEFRVWDEHKTSVS